ncbi:MAG: ergothioneine biosynthesis protein EgtB [Actinomycetota bacterium]|nr:ergothioneine biosynthesis protein EgtB [Actinomycetota bacterium]
MSAARADTGTADADPAGLKEWVAQELAAARHRSLAILEPLSDDDQRRQHSVLMSPLAWDLAHVGNYEELWLLRAATAHPGVRPSVDTMYDAFRHPRANRPALPLLSPAEARAYVAEVRAEVLGALDRVELDGAPPLLAGAFVYGMVVQHEHQHDETMLATRQLMEERAAPLTGAAPAPPGGPVGGEEVLVDGGTFPMGTDVDPWAYDNERPAHRVTLDPFLIDTAPVTCAGYAAFVEAGGYHDPRLWSAEGWAWRQQAGLEHPQFWRREGDGGWSLLRFGRRLDLRPDEPVQHVCWYEAEACARWMGKRLPTEAEWEMAACWDPAAGKRRHPWGDGRPGAEHANLGGRGDGPAPVGAYPAGVSPWGCHQMLGDVWEWTASDFTAYPGFRSFPYREYSEVFFGADYKVLRGGSWATAPLAVRGTFRNWDHPIRRQIFAGFRCARDAGRR